MPLWKALSQAMTGTRLQCALPWVSFSPTLVLLGPAKTDIDAVPTQLYWKAGTGEYQPVTKYQMYPKHHLYFNNLWCFPMCLQRMASQRQEMQCSLCSIPVGGNPRGTSVMSSWLWVEEQAHPAGPAAAAVASPSEGKGTSWACSPWRGFPRWHVHGALSTGGHKEHGGSLCHRELQQAALPQELSVVEGPEQPHAACHACLKRKL